MVLFCFHLRFSLYTGTLYCKVGIAHLNRDRLLHLVDLTPIAWGLGSGIYIRNVYITSRLMSEMPREHLGQRILSMLLDLYLSFLSFCGLIGMVGTINFGYRYRDDLKDLLTSIAEVDDELERRVVKQERNAIIENGRYRVQSQRMARAVNRGQAISATLALERGVSIVVGPFRSCFLHPPEAHHRHPIPVPIPTSPSHIANPLPYTLRKGRGPSMLEFGKK